MKTVAELTQEFKTGYPKIAEFLQKLESKGIRFEIDGKGDDLMLGINTYTHIWSWFRLTNLNSSEWADFRGSYSMNTGRTQKSLKRQRKVVTELHRQLEITGGDGYNLI